MENAMKPCKRKSGRSPRQAGNIFFMLFGAVALVGAFAAGSSNVMKGLVTSMSDVTRKTIAEEKMMGGARLTIMSATEKQSGAGDCDGDGFVEPLPYRDAGAGPRPAGGGYLPEDIGATLTDPWGTPYGYCAWDPGPTNVTSNNPGCGGNTAKRLDGSALSNGVAVAIISAGKDRKFSSTCGPQAAVAQNCSGLGDSFYNDPITGHCYYRSASTAQYAAAKTACEANGGYLAAITSASEQITVENNIAVNANMYIGADDLAVDGEWRYLGGELAGQQFWQGVQSGSVIGGRYSNWYGTEPNNYASSEHCAIMGGHGGSTNADNGWWLDFPCNVPLKYLCEKSPPDIKAVQKAAGSDDIVMEYTYDDASGVSPDDLWEVRDVDPTTAAIEKSVDVGGSASMSGVLRLENKGLVLPDHLTLTTCSAATDQQLRINFSASPPVLEICDFAGGNGWTPMTMGEKDYPYCNFGTIAEVHSYPTSQGGKYTIVGDYMFGSSWGNNLFISNRIANPLTAWSSGSRSDNINGASHAIAVGNYAYQLSYNNQRMIVFNITNPESMGYVTQLVDAKLQYPSTLAKFGDYVAVIGTGPGRFNMINVSTPSSPTIGATASIVDTWFTSAPGMTTDNKYAYVTSASNDGIVIVDLTNPDAPAIVTKYSNPALDGANQIVVRGDYAYVTAKVGDALTVVDVSNPLSPMIAGTITNSKLNDATALQIVGNYAFVTSQWGLTVIEIDEPLAMVIVASMTTPWPSEVVAVKGQYAFANYYAAATINLNCDPLIGDGSTGNGASANAGAGATPAGYGLTSGLVGYWKMDEGTGTTVSDSSGSGNILTFVTAPADPSWSNTSHLGKSLLYNESEQDRASVPDSDSLDLTSFTISAWFNSSGATSWSQYILEKGQNSASDFNYYLILNPTANAVCGFHDGSGFREITSTSTIPYGQWHHIACTFDNNAKTAKIYLNNAVIASGTLNYKPAINATPLWIGFSGSWNDGSFNGYLDQIRLYNRALTDPEITMLYNDTGAGSGTYVSTAPSPSLTAAIDRNRGRIARGNELSCMVKPDNRAWCWGNDNNGTLGNGATTGQQVSPSQVENISFTQVGTGNYFACGLSTTHAIYCWGSDSSGKLGNGAVVTADQISPYIISDAGPWSQVSVGFDHACGLKLDGSAWCWGYGGSGELGNSGISNQASPVAVSNGHKWISIFSGTANTCGIQSNGSAWCWGSNSDNRLGTLATPTNVPKPVVDPGPWVYLAPGLHATCGVKLDGSAWCWGNNSYGLLGIGDTSKTESTFPLRVSDPGPWISVHTDKSAMLSTNGYMACGIKTDGSAWCWGRDVNGSLGNGSTITADQPAPYPVGDPGPWADISILGNIVCGLKVNGSAWCWGADTSGVLGNGSVLTAIQHVPSPVENSINRAPWEWQDNTNLAAAGTANMAMGTTYGMSFDGTSVSGVPNGLAFPAPGEIMLRQNPGGSDLTLESLSATTAAQIGFKAASAAATRAVGIDYLTGSLEFGLNNATMTNWMTAISPQMEITAGGNVGIGTTGTVRYKLEVNGGLRIGNDTETCGSHKTGTIRFVGGTTPWEYCDGTAWTAL